jgi:ribonuclease P protein component
MLNPIKIPEHAQPRPQALRPHERLAGRRDFDRIFGRKHSVSNAQFVVYADANGLPHARIAVIVSRKVSRSSVVRHRVKRVVREAYRTSKPLFAPGFDFVIIARLAKLSFAEALTGLAELAPQAVRRASRDARPAP